MTIFFDCANSIYPDQTAPKEHSDQGLHCLLDIFKTYIYPTPSPPPPPPKKKKKNLLRFLKVEKSDFNIAETEMPYSFGKYGRYFKKARTQ